MLWIQSMCSESPSNIIIAVMLRYSQTWWSSKQWMRACLNKLEMFCSREKIIVLITIDTSVWTPIWTLKNVFTHLDLADIWTNLHTCPDTSGYSAMSRSLCGCLTRHLTVNMQTPNTDTCLDTVDICTHEDSHLDIWTFQECFDVHPDIQTLDKQLDTWPGTWLTFRFLSKHLSGCQAPNRYPDTCELVQKIIQTLSVFANTCLDTCADVQMHLNTCLVNWWRSRCLCSYLETYVDVLKCHTLLWMSRYHQSMSGCPCTHLTSFYASWYIQRLLLMSTHLQRHFWIFWHPSTHWLNVQAITGCLEMHHKCSQDQHWTLGRWMGNIGVYMCHILSHWHQPCDQKHCTQTTFHVIDTYHWTNMSTTLQVYITLPSSYMSK